MHRNRGRICRFKHATADKAGKVAPRFPFVDELLLAVFAAKPGFARRRTPAFRPGSLPSLLPCSVSEAST